MQNKINMKKIIFLFILVCLFSHVALLAKEKLSGVYYNKSGMCIKIENGVFYFIVPQAPPVLYNNDTLLQSTIKRVDDHFIELNSSVPAYVVGHKGLSITQFYDPKVQDSIKVSFSIPYQRSDLRIEVYTETFKTYRLTYSKNNKELNIPSDAKSIQFHISPEYLLQHSFEGLFYGVVGFDSNEAYQIDGDTNSIKIEIPGVDDSFFERYYAKGEYARIEGDSIIWKGDTFVKRD